MSRQDDYQRYELSEAQLLAELRSGQPQAVEYWYKHYHDRLKNLIFTKIENQRDAEELVQEVFINALKQLPLFRGEAQLMTWMQSIARHEMADYFRKKYAKKAIHWLPLTDQLAQVLLPGHVEDSHQISEKVKLAVQALSSHQQELLFLKYLDNRKVVELASELGKSVKAIESDLFRARAAFKVAYENLPD